MFLFAVVTLVGGLTVMLNTAEYRQCCSVQNITFENVCERIHAIRFEPLEQVKFHNEPKNATSATPTRHRYEKLSKQIWSKFQHNQENVESLTRKLDVFTRLSRQIQEYDGFNTTHQLQLYGSTLSTISTNVADLDITLVAPHSNKTTTRNDDINLLDGISTHFAIGVQNLTRNELTLAKVPILNLRLYGVDVDLSVYNAIGIKKSILLRTYARCDWRVRPIVLAVKLWAKTQGINNAKRGTLASFILTLMVIHYLQYGATTSILPVLEITGEERFEEQAELWRATVSTDMVSAASLGELFLGFLEYFAIKFDYKGTGFSVRTGGTIKTAIGSSMTNQKKYIFFEDPFGLTNITRSVCKINAFERIRGVLFLSWKRLKVRNDLNTVFEVTPKVEAEIVGSYARYCTLPYHRVFGTWCAGFLTEVV